MGDSSKSKLSKNDGFYIADYSNEDDAAYVLESLGGEKFLKENFPLVYEAFKKTKIEHSNRKAGNYEPKCRLDLSSLVKDKKNIKTQISAFTTDPDMTIEKLNKGKSARKWLSANISVEYFNRNDPSLPYPSENFYMEDTNQFYFKSKVVLATEKETEQCSVRSILTGFNPDGTMETIKNDQMSPAVPAALIHEFTAKAPVSSKGNNPIMMLYGRNRNSAGSYVNADYYDDGPGEYYNNAPKNNAFKTLMPMAGKIEFQSGSVILEPVLRKPVITRSRINVGETDVATHFKNIKSDDEFFDILKTCFKADTSGYYPAVNFEIKGNGNKGWDKDSVNWFSDVEGVNAWSDYAVIYFLQAGFPLQVVAPNGVPSIVNITIASRPADQMLPGEQYYKSTNGQVFVPPIIVHWGCFARDTPVRLSCGTDKRMDELKPGDKVVSSGGHCVTFTENVSGEEEKIFRIKTENGEIRLTGGHPVMMNDGTTLCAGYIKPGDVLKGPYEGHTVLESKEENYNDTVLNPVFRESGVNGLYILTNGFYCGDYNAQNKPPKPSVSALTQENAALNEEFKRLCKTLK